VEGGIYIVNSAIAVERANVQGRLFGSCACWKSKRNCRVEAATMTSDFRFGAVLAKHCSGHYIENLSIAQGLALRSIDFFFLQIFV
jgi:hypothetical protein